MNLQFDFQGSQNLHIRVPISQKANEVDFQFPTKIVGKIVANNAMITEFLEIIL